MRMPTAMPDDATAAGTKMDAPALSPERTSADGRVQESVLARAFDAQADAAALGFDWPDAQGPIACVREEADEVAELLLAADAGPDRGSRTGVDAALQDEVGDLLFAAVNLARAAGVGPRTALAQATEKFERRFRRVRELARARGLAMPGTSLERLDRLWDEAKAEEAAGKQARRDVLADGARQG